MFSDRELFSMFNIDLPRKRHNGRKPTRQLGLPINTPAWSIRDIDSKISQYRGKTENIDLAPHLPGKSGSTERIEYLTKYYTQATETSPFDK